MVPWNSGRRPNRVRGSDGEDYSMNRLGLFASVATAALTIATNAAAQTAEEAPAAVATETTTFSEDEILVTAQRREERLQDIPIAISAFGASQIERQGIISIESIAPRVPSVYFGSFGALRPQLYIRGIGTRTFDPGSESSVGVFADDVYLGRSSGSFGAIRDIERVEVLRGPQGTLYGRNTIGGAINVITKGPSDSFEAQAEVGVSNFNGWDVFGAVGGPITGDGALKFRVAGWHNERDGYVTNLRTGTKFQGIDNSGARIRLEYEPSDNFKIDLTGEYLHDGDKGGFQGVNQGTGRSSTGAPGNPSAVFFAAASRLPTQQLPLSLREAYFSGDPILNRNAYAGIARIETGLGFATLTSITGYRRLEVQDSRDLEGSSLDVLFQTSDETSDQWTQELRLTSDPDGALSFGGSVDWIVGAFYYNDKSYRDDFFRVGLDSAVRAAAGTIATDTTFSDYKIESYAFFGQATIHVSDKFDITLGGRYTNDKKRATQGATSTDALPIVPANYVTTNSATYTSFDPRIVLDYKINPDVSVYASYSTGFKSGGFQYVPFNLGAANTLFAPEDIKTYEIGLKSEWLDRHLRLNVAAFRYDYKNLQVARIVDTPNGPQSLTTNAAASKVQGIDIEMLLRPSDNFDVGVTYGYLDAKYKNYFTTISGTPVSYDGTRMVRAPEHTINVGAEWRIPLGDSDDRVTLRADYALLSDFYFEPGEGNSIFGSGTPLTKEESYGLLDLRATFDISNFRITAYVNNATNKEYRRTVNGLGNTIVGFAGTPRIYGLRIAYSY